MTSITAQQTKLDLELVPKENRLNIKKCNGRIPRGLKLKKETFQVVLDALALTPCYPAFLITTDVPEICPRVPSHDFDALPSEEDTLSFLRDLGHTGVINSLNDIVIDQMHQPWRTFAALINRSLSRKTSGLNKLRLSRAQILWGIKEASQKYGVVLPECLSSPEMKESKAYKTYLSYATGAMPPKNGKRVKRAAKKPSTTPTTGIIIREPTVEIKSKRKEKEKVDVAHGKGIELVSDVALMEEAQMKEVRKKSLRDFHKTHLSGSGMVAKDPPSVAKITPTVTSEGTGDKPRVPDVTNDDSTKSESESWGNDEDDNNNEQESSDEGDEEENENDDDLESQSDDAIESDEEKEMDDTKEVVQGEGADTEMHDAQQGNENLETTQEQVIEDAHETISTITKKTEVLVTSSSLSSDLASKFLNFLDIPITALEKEVVKLKKDPLHTQVTSLVDSHLDTRLGETRQEFMNFLSESLTARIKEQMIEESRNEVTLAKVSSQPHSSYEVAATLIEFELKKILIDKIEKSESYLTAPEHRDCYDGLKKSYEVDKDYFSSYDVYSLKQSRQDKDKDEDPSAGSDRGLKKRKRSKDAELTGELKKKDSTSGSSKSQLKSSKKFVQSEEPVFEVADSKMPQDQEGNLSDNEDEPRNETASRHDWFKKPTPP
ncbi:hypothetical protein Tco_0744871, partial [Tanacetum coccineum]